MKQKIWIILIVIATVLDVNISNIRVIAHAFVLGAIAWPMVLSIRDTK